jgi:hypothetical protein
MKNFQLLSLILALFVIVSCGEKNDSDQEEATPNDETQVAEQETVETEEAEEVEVTTELYCNVYKEINAIKMEKYWDKFKDKEYEEVKDVYEDYLKEEQTILEKYGLEGFGDLQSYFREHFKEIEEYRANDPEYVEYPNYQEVKFKLAEFAGAKADEEAEKLIDAIK